MRKSLIALTVVIPMLLVTSVCRANFLTNPGFEVPEQTNEGLPAGSPYFGNWIGDNSEIVTAQDGIVPFEGTRMLQMLNTQPGGAFYTTSGELFQLVDLSAYVGAIRAGGVMLDGSIQVNRITGDATTDTSFSLRLWAMSRARTAPGSFVALSSSEGLATETTSTIVDADPGSWQLVSAVLDLPVETDYAILQFAFDENVSNDGSGIEFDGHYMDAATLTLSAVPEPSTIVLLILGGPPVVGASLCRADRSTRRRPR